MFFQAIQIIRHIKFIAIFAMIMDLFCCGLFNKLLDVFSEACLHSCTS